MVHIKKILIITLLISTLLLTGCSKESDLGDFLIAQNAAISKCERQSMEYVGIKMFAQEHFSVVCRTTSPIKYYEYPVR